MGSPEDERRVVLPSSQTPDQSGGKPGVPVMGTQDADCGAGVLFWF